jgi:hypothetical protein
VNCAPPCRRPTSPFPTAPKTRRNNGAAL